MNGATGVSRYMNVHMEDRYMSSRSEHVCVNDCMQPYVLEPGHLKENYLQEFTTISVYVSWRYSV